MNKDRLKSNVTRASCFTGISKYSETIEALGLVLSLCFLVFGNPGKTLALVLNILQQELKNVALKVERC